MKAIKGLQALSLMLLLNACGGAASKSDSSQVVARVNDGELSVHQLNDVLARTPRDGERPLADVSRQALERLIDQELLVQQAISLKLDRDPQVMRALELARRELLAKAYLERLGSAPRTIDSATIDKFYQENPALFNERRVYHSEQLRFAITAEQRPALLATIEAAAGLNDVEAWLKQQNIQVTRSAHQRPAEQLPLALLPKFAAMKEGEVSLFQDNGSLLLVQLLDAQLQPLGETAAAPLIEQYLRQQQLTQSASKELERLRGSANIQYLGAFADTPPPAAKPAAPASEISPLEKGAAGL